MDTSWMDRSHFESRFDYEDVCLDCGKVFVHPREEATIFRCPPCQANFRIKTNGKQADIHNLEKLKEKD